MYGEVQEEYTLSTPSTKRKIKVSRCLFTSSIKCEIRHFHVVVVQKRAKTMYKKSWYTCKVVVLLIKPIIFLTYSLPSASLDLKVCPESAEFLMRHLWCRTIDPILNIVFRQFVLGLNGAYPVQCRIRGITALTKACSRTCASLFQGPV